MFSDIFPLPFLTRERTEVCYPQGRDGEEVRIKLISENAQERGRAATYATKEPETLEWIRRYTTPGDVFWDIGANVGLYSLFAAKLGCHVWAFEPHLPNANKLFRNVVENELSGKIKVIPIAVANEESFGGMAVRSLEPGSSLHNFEAAPWTVSHHGSTQCTTITADDPSNPKTVPGNAVFCSYTDRLVLKWGFPEPNHVKIDVDGRDKDVLEGMCGIIDDEILRTILIEVHDDNMDEMREFMARYDFHEDDTFPETSRAREKRRAVTEGGKWSGCGNQIFVRK